MQRRGFPKGASVFVRKPCYNKFDELEPVDKDFSDHVGEFLTLFLAWVQHFHIVFSSRTTASPVEGWQWREPRLDYIPRPCAPFQTKYDTIQQQQESVLVRIEPFKTRSWWKKKVSMLYVRLRMQQASIYHWTQLVVM